MVEFELKRREGFGEDYRSVWLNGQPVGRVRRVAGQWRGFATFTDRTPAKRAVEWTPAAVCDTAEGAARAVVAQYLAENLVLKEGS